MKCLPQSKLHLVQGNVLHDSHAETLAIRAFNRWLLDECKALAERGGEQRHEWIRWRSSQERYASETSGEATDWQAQPFAINDDVSVYIYCSQGPCGDASMELTMRSQPDDTPWTLQPPADEMLGRGNFDRLGVVRRKPARPDAQMTLSKSCSDKLALKQATSLLSGITTLIVHPGNAYLDVLILPDADYVEGAIQRAFSRQGRMKAVDDGDWAAGYAFHPFDVRTTSRIFEHGKQSGEGVETVPSNLSAVATPDFEESLINGVLQGRKQLDPRGASALSRRRLVESVKSLAELLDDVEVKRGTYADIKAMQELRGREYVKRKVRENALQGWKRNEGDESWRVE